MTAAHLRLAYDARGDGPVVLFVHALGMDMAFWDEFTASLSSQRRCVLVDLPGHGRSTRARAPYSVEDVADAVAAALPAHAPGAVDVVGASMGGMVALALAQRHPAMVRRLVLVDTTAVYSAELRAQWYDRAEVVRTRGLQPLVEHLLAIWFSPGYLATDAPPVRYVRDRLARCAPEAYADACDALRRADLRPGVGSVTVPAVVIAGSDDVLADDCRWLAEHLPDARMAWLQGGRHAACLEFPARFTSLIRVFLDSHDGQQVHA